MGAVVCRELESPDTRKLSECKKSHTKILEYHYS